MTDVGPINHVIANVKPVDTKGVSSFIVDAKDVTLRALNWDIDGDTRYESNPNCVHVRGGEESGRVNSRVMSPDLQSSSLAA